MFHEFAIGLWKKITLQYRCQCSYLAWDLFMDPWLNRTVCNGLKLGTPLHTLQGLDLCYAVLVG